MPPVPLLFLSDSPELPTGLGRITRDLATLASRLPEFRVGVLGRGGNGSRQLPFVPYNFGESEQWGENVIERVWDDFAGDMRGIIFTIWDTTRLAWFAQPSYLRGGSLRNFLEAGHFSRWGYFPIDSIGPRGRLSILPRSTLLGYDRVLAYTSWASSLITCSIGDEAAVRRGVDWLPHGLNLRVFTPHDKREARKVLGGVVHANDLLVGVVMTNQARKDWGLTATICAELRKCFGATIRFWWHVDVLERHWSINALLTDFGLSDCTVVSHHWEDAELARAYSACDLTMLPSLGEGFGYPIVESLACGTPVLHGDYAGGAELIPKPEWKVPVQAWRLGTQYNCLRPVFDPDEWVSRAAAVLSQAQPERDFCRASVEHLDWARLWKGCWKKWLMEGLRWQTQETQQA